MPRILSGKGREDMQKDDFKGLKWQTKPRKSITLCGLGMTWEGEFCQESVCSYPIESLFQRETALRMFRPSNLPLAFERACAEENPKLQGCAHSASSDSSDSARLRSIFF